MSSDQSNNATPTNTTNTNTNTTTNNNNNNNNSKKRKNMNDNNTKNNRTLMDYWAKKYHQSRELEIKSLMMMDSSSSTTTSSSSSSSSSSSDEKRPKFNDLLLTNNNNNNNNNNKYNNKCNDNSSNSKNPIEVDEDISIVDDDPIGVSSSSTNQDYNKWHKKSNKIQLNNNNTNNTNNTNYNTNNSDDRWDSKHVKLPCSSHNTFLVTSPYHSSGNSLTKSNSKSKWYLIQTLLKQQISNVYELQDLIQSMKNCGNSGHTQISMDMTMLFDFFQSYIPRENRDEFFARILPWMQKMALRLPDLLPRSVPLLKKQRESSVELTAEQVACLMCHAFFCTFPRRDKLNNRRDHEYFTFPNINFTELYRGTRSVDTEKMMAAKLQTIVQYFDHVSRHESELSARTIGFHRRVIALYNGSKSKSTEYQHVLDYKDGDSEKEDETEEENPILTMWKNSTEKLISCKVSLDGTIEDELNSSQVDFANKFIGGGVIGRGCVQEEIRFLINTECIISRLFTEEFDDNECMIIRGARRFSKYTGYADTYRFDGPYDGPVSDKEEIVCIDALNFVDRTMFRSTTDQYKPEWIQRELNKAYCSFQKLSYDTYNHDMKIATGHWGGGAFSGDRELKAIIQLMAASQAKREAVSYFAYADEDFVKKFDPMYSNLVCIEATVGELYTCLMEYRAKRVQARQKQKSIGIIGRVPSVLDFVFGWFVAETNDPFDEIPPTEPLTQPETILDTSTTENAETIDEKL